MGDNREAQFLIAVGKRGVGKTYRSLDGIKNYPRKVLILDVNGEYANPRLTHKNPSFPIVRAIDPKDLLKWNLNGINEVRRISPMRTGKKGGRMSLKEIREVLEVVLQTFQNGLLIIEDITKFISDNLPNDLIGMIATLRHSSVDVITHFQSIGKAGNPQLWANMNILRYHKVDDRMERQKSKFGGSPTVLFIAEKLVDIQYKKGNKRFCIFLNKDYGQLFGCTKEMFREAVEEYLQDNPSIMKKEIAREDLKTGKKIHKNRLAVYHYLMEYYENEYYRTTLN